MMAWEYSTIAMLVGSAACLLGSWREKWRSPAVIAYAAFSAASFAGTLEIGLVKMERTAESAEPEAAVSITAGDDVPEHRGFIGCVNGRLYFANLDIVGLKKPLIYIRDGMCDPGDGK